MSKFLKRYMLGTISIFVGVLLLFFIFSGKIESLSSVSGFLNDIENKTFDIRQRITSASRHHNENIVVLAIDDLTYEYVSEKYGEWPMPRYIYADVIDYIETQNPDYIAFDLLFVNSLKSNNNDDKKLSDLFKTYKNLYTAIMFDDMSSDLRTPPTLDEKLSVNLNTSIDIAEAPNTRPILSTIINNTSNIGHINVQRDNDGVLREYIPFVKYQGKYYPHMSMLLAQNKMGSLTNDYTITKNMKLKFADKSYPITNKGTVFLNWYGEGKTFEYISMADVISAIQKHKEGKTSKLDNKFTNKIIFIGTTVTSLHDLKTVPTGKEYAGVETHATFVNNLLDNSLVHRLSFKWDFAITLILCLFIGLSMLRVEYSKINYKYLIPINSSILIGTLVVYYISTILLMKYLNLWIAVIMPTVGLIITFTSIYVIRYFFKSKDYEYTYRLATTDGLTELYNHRYFQEQMIEFIENSKKSGKKFSLILTDIDFFKKFNDQYGHQAGDAVLRQVAKTLKKNVKKWDLVCRYGGEEMSVILKNADKKAALMVAQRLCNAVAGRIFKLGENLESHVTISLGVSTYPDDGSTPTELIEYSDRGLYAAKENGRNQVGIIKDDVKN